MIMFLAKLKNEKPLEVKFQTDSKKIMFFTQDCVSEWDYRKIGVNLSVMATHYSIQIFAEGKYYIRFNCLPESYLDARNFFFGLGFQLPDSPATMELIKDGRT